MLSLPSDNDLLQLKKHNDELCVSIFLPGDIQNSGAKMISYKNKLRKARVLLGNRGYSEAESDSFLRSAWELVGKNDIWLNDHQGTCFFIKQGEAVYFGLPNNEDINCLKLQRGFYLKPLNRMLRSNKEYFILALSHNNVKLYRGDNFDIHEIRLKNFPTNMEDALGIDEYPKILESHTIKLNGSARGTKAFHGQFNKSQTDKLMLKNFFRRIDSHLHNFLYTKNLPLIVAGVEYLIPIYKKINTYPKMITSNIKGNLEKSQPDAIKHLALDALNS